MKTHEPRAATEPRTIQSAKGRHPQADPEDILQAYAGKISHYTGEAFPDNQTEASINGDRSQLKNQTGMPDNLKSGIEKVSGYSMDNIRVNYNSPKPAQLKALAYAQGTDIHIGPGQEQHLPHEAWHVVQQMQGRVNPTMQMRGIGINDNTSLEKEADAMGAYAAGTSNGNGPDIQFKKPMGIGGTVQRHMGVEMELDVPVYTPMNDPNHRLSTEAAGCLYSSTEYTRTDISGNAAASGFQIQLDHSSNGRALCEINNKYVKQHVPELLNNTNNRIANLEFVIGGATGTDEEDDVQKQQLIDNAAAVADYIDELVRTVKTSNNAIAIGGFRVGVPRNDLFAPPGTTEPILEESATDGIRGSDPVAIAHRGPDPTLAEEYATFLTDLDTSVYMQVTAGVSPAKVMNFIKPDVKYTPYKYDDNPLTFANYHTKMPGKTIMYDHVNKYASDGYGLRSYLKSKNPRELVNKPRYHDMLKGYVMLMTQQVFSKLLCEPSVGDWDHNGHSCQKNTMYMLPQSFCSSIIPNSAPAALRGFLAENKESVKSKIKSKIDSIYTGGWFGINIEDCIAAVRNVNRSVKMPANDQMEAGIKHVLYDHTDTIKEPDDKNKEVTRKVPVKGFINEVVDQFFSKIGGEDTDHKWLSLRNFTYHPVDSADSGQGNKIPIEFRFVREYEIKSSKIASTVTNLTEDIKKRNK